MLYNKRRNKFTKTEGLQQSSGVQASRPATALELEYISPDSQSVPRDMMPCETNMKLEAIRDLKPPPKMVLPPDEHNKVSVCALAKKILDNPESTTKSSGFPPQSSHFLLGHVRPLEKIIL